MSKKSSDTTSRKARFRVQKSRSPPIVELRKQLLDAKTKDQVDDAHEALMNMLACPYAKKYPELVSRSCLTGWSSMARLKEHLHRKHKRPPICARCQNEFRTTGELTSHQRAHQPCDIQPATSKPENLWLSDEVYEMLSRRSRKGQDQTEAWKYIYSCIFKDSEPPSPYLPFPDDPKSQRQRTLRDFAQSLMNECQRTVDAACADNRPPFLTIDDVASITQGIIGEGFSIQDIMGSSTTECSGVTPSTERDVLEIEEQEHERARTSIDLCSTMTAGHNKKPLPSWTRLQRKFCCTTMAEHSKRSLPLCQPDCMVSQKVPLGSSGGICPDLLLWPDVANDPTVSQASNTFPVDDDIADYLCRYLPTHDRTRLSAENQTMSSGQDANLPQWAWANYSSWLD